MSQLDPTVRRLGLEMLKAIRSLSTVLVDRFPESFGGIYNRGDNQTFIVLTVGEDRELRAFVATHLREATTGDPALLAQLPTVRFRSVARTFRSLRDLSARIMAERDDLQAQGITVYSAGVRHDRNCVAIMAAPTSEAQRQELAHRYGTDVEVIHTSPPRRLA
jgi:hypothetical protein